MPSSTASKHRLKPHTHTHTHLLVLDSLGELVAEGKVGDRDVVHDEVELLRAVGELVADAGADGLTLAEELLGVVLGHDRLENLEEKKKKKWGCVREASRRHIVGPRSKHAERREKETNTGKRTMRRVTSVA